MSAAPLIPPNRSLAALKRAALGCKACPLWHDTTQTVFGEGPAHAKMMLIGEEPGDQEDKQGRVFVGPAGHLLDTALKLAGLDRKTLYLTNAVKHFKHVPRGKRRIHSKPNRTESVACRPWVERELQLVMPEVVVLMGAVAAQSLLGPSFRITQHRGELIASDLAPLVVATIHPSAVLRAPTPEARHEMMTALVKDLKFAHRAMLALERHHAA